ncbi:MAG: hypothetical protein ACOX3K_03705 [Bacilli bacterium]
MEIVYDDRRVALLFENFELMKRKKGIEITRRIKMRYDVLKAAISFAEFLKIAPGNPHALKGDKKGLFAVSVDKNKRLILQPMTENGDVSLIAFAQCDKVIIKGVEDYHGGKTTTYIP